MPSHLYTHPTVDALDPFISIFVPPYHTRHPRASSDAHTRPPMLRSTLMVVLPPAPHARSAASHSPASVSPPSPPQGTFVAPSLQTLTWISSPAADAFYADYLVMSMVVSCALYMEGTAWRDCTGGLRFGGALH